MTPDQSDTRELVSIVIPVYNGGRYISQAIESALAQSWPAIEIIVVNDGSDDGGATERIVQRYGNAVRVIVKPNGGVATALNAGIAAMRGQWFSWLSHDDLYLPLKIERYMAALKAVGAPAIAFGDVEYIDAEGRAIGTGRLTRGFSADDDPRWQVLEGRLNGCAMLVPRVCLEACGWFDPGLPTTQDYAYWFQMAGRYPFVTVREPLVRSRIHPEQGSRHARHLEEASLLWITMLEQLDREDRSGDPRQRLRRLRRVGKFLQVSAYTGARAYVETQTAACLAEIPVTLICAGDGHSDPGMALQTLSAAGARCTEILLVDRRNDASATIEKAAAPWSRIALTTRLTGVAPRPSSVLAAAAMSSTSLLVFLDSSSPVDPLALRDGLVAVATGETDGWLTGAASGPEQRWLGALCGSVLGRDAAANAARSGEYALQELGLRSRLSIARPSAVPAKPVRPPHPGPVPRAHIPRRPLPLALPLRPTHPTLLILVHSWGGGTIRYADTVANLVKPRVNVLFGWGVEDRRFYLSSVGADIPEVEYELPDGLDQLIADLHACSVSRIDVMHSIGFEGNLGRLLDSLGVPFDLTLLDYHQLAFQPHLVDPSGHFVGDDALADLDHPLLRPGPPPVWVRTADRVIACSRDLAGRFHQLVHGLPIIAARLPEPGNPGRFALHGPILAPGHEMRVLYLGRLAFHKGMSTVTCVADLLLEHQRRIRIDCLGALDTVPPRDVLVNPHLRLLGSYAQDDLHALICRIRPHLAWLPFMAPETHSFSLSEVMLHGLPVLATGLGAIPERLEGRRSTWVVAPDEASPHGLTQWLERLQDERLTTSPRWLPTNHLPPLTPYFYEREYLRPVTG